MTARRVMPLASFGGYPGGVKTAFKAGVPATVPADYAVMLAAKGLIDPAARIPDPDTSEPETAPKPHRGLRSRLGEGGVSGVSLITPDKPTE